MTVSRRALLQGSAIGVGALTMPQFLSAAMAAPLGLSPVIVTDPSLPASRKVAHYASQHGLELSDQGADLASLFYGTKGQPFAGRPLIGATGYAAFVVARGLAREQGRAFSETPPNTAGDGLSRLCTDISAHCAQMPSFVWIMQSRG